MVFSTPTVFLSADQAALIKNCVVVPPNPSELPWSPMPKLDEQAIELKERQEEARKRLEAERAAAAERLQLEGEHSNSLYGSFRAQRPAGTAEPSLSSASMFSSSVSKPRRPNLGGALRKLEEASSGMNLPDMEVPDGFSDSDSLSEKAQSISFGTFGQVGSSSRHRPRREDRETKENATSDRPSRRASRSREINLNFLNNQVFGN
ncbi:MAG: hypothetical protein ACI376_07715 [Candidatus Bruticola sp.]